MLPLYHLVSCSLNTDSFGSREPWLKSCPGACPQDCTDYGEMAQVCLQFRYAVFEMSVVGQQQHSSIPPRHSVVGILAGAVARLEAYQQPSRYY